MGRAKVQAFLTHLAVEEHVSASTQNQALSALLFLYREVLHHHPGDIDALRNKSAGDAPEKAAGTSIVTSCNGEPCSQIAFTSKMYIASGSGSANRARACYNLSGGAP